MQSTCLAQTPSIVMRDEQIKSGSIDYVRTDDAGADRVITEEHVSFAEDGRLLHRIHSPIRLSKELKTITFVRGKTWQYIHREFRNRHEVTFPRDRAWPRDEDWRFFLVGEPCLALATGLSRANSWRQTQSGGSRFLLGTLGDDTILKVKVSETDQILEVSRLFGGQELNRWTYQGFVETGRPLTLPAVAQYQVLSGVRKTERRFDIKKADLLNVPRDSSLVTAWFASGVTVIDDRVEPQVVWEYDDLLKANGGRRELTPEQLLSLSQQRAEFLSRNESSKKKQLLRRQVQSSKTASTFLAVLGFAIVVLVAVVSVSALMRRRRGV